MVARQFLQLRFPRNVLQGTRSKRGDQQHTKPPLKRAVNIRDRTVFNIDCFNTGGPALPLNSAGFLPVSVHYPAVIGRWRP